MDYDFDCDDLPDLETAYSYSPIPEPTVHALNTAANIVDDNAQSGPIVTKKRARPKADAEEIAARKLARQLEREKVQREKEEKKLKKDAEKQKRDRDRLELEFEKSKKRLLQETKRNCRPGECMKHVTVVLDTVLLTHPCGTAIAACLQTHDVRYEVSQQSKPYTISFWREVTEVKETEPQKLEKLSKEVIEDEILIYVPTAQFVQLVDASQKVREGVLMPGANDSTTLVQFVRDGKSALGNRPLTLLVSQMESYFRQQKTTDKRAYRNDVLKVGRGNDDGDVQAAGKWKRKADDDSAMCVRRSAVEEAVLEVQLQTGCHVKFTETEVELATTVLQYVKAVAERPFKQDRLNNGFSMFVEGHGVRVGAAGQGLVQVWREQLQQFKNVSAEVANAIVANYPSPKALFDAYQACTSEKEAESLLEDIVVRRGAGVMATVRRIGKEMSRRMYVLLTSVDPQLVIR